MARSLVAAGACLALAIAAAAGTVPDAGAAGSAPAAGPTAEQYEPTAQQVRQQVRPDGGRESGLAAKAVGSLPFTGVDIIIVLSIGFMLGTTGVLLARLSRRAGGEVEDASS